MMYGDSEWFNAHIFSLSLVCTRVNGRKAAWWLFTGEKLSISNSFELKYQVWQDTANAIN